MQQTKWRDVPKQNGDADGEEEASNAKSAEENEKKTQKRKEAESEKKMAARWLTAVGQGWPVEMHAKRRAREEEEKKTKDERNNPHGCRHPEENRCESIKHLVRESLVFALLLLGTRKNKRTKIARNLVR